MPTMLHFTLYSLRQPCRLPGGVAFGSTSDPCSCTRHGKRASSRRPPGRARLCPCFAPSSPVRSRRYYGWNTASRGSWDGASCRGSATAGRRSTDAALLSCSLPPARSASLSPAPHSSCHLSLSLSLSLLLRLPSVGVSCLVSGDARRGPEADARRREGACIHLPTVSESDIKNTTQQQKQRGEERREQWTRTPDQRDTGACTTGGNARYGRRAAARYLVAGTATTKPRIHWRSASTTATCFPVATSSWLSALSATKNRMYNRIVQIVEHVSVSKNQFHCDGCGICRTGGAENFYHCDKCGCCYTSLLKDSHRCVDRAMHHNCPVCIEYLFDSTKAISVLHCGHAIHLECLYKMRAHQQFSCPVCLRSACNMSDIWQKLDQEVAASPMPAIYQKKMIWILCNDCGMTASVQFHILAHKCPRCSSYNTRQTRGDPAACSRV